MNKINEDTAYFNTMLPTKYLCGITIVYDICKDYGEGERLGGGTLYVPDFYLTDSFMKLLHEVFTYEEYPLFDEWKEEHFMHDMEALERLGFDDLEYLCDENQQYAAKATIRFAFQLDETMRMREVVLNG